jgi:hypothetical protein
MLNPFRSRSWLAVLLVLGVVSTTPAEGQSTNGKRLATPADCGKWETLGAGALSPDGRWLASHLNRVNDENELMLRALDRDSTIVVAYGSGATFSEAAPWVACRIGVSEAQREKLERDKKQVRNKLGLVNLGTGAKAEIPVTLARPAGSRPGAPRRGVATREDPASKRTGSATRRSND